jgi:acetyl esterase
MTSLSMRKRIALGASVLRLSAVDGAVHALTRLRFMLPDAQPRRYDVVLERDVVYGPTTARGHRLDVYMPVRAPKPLPVIMYVHGGGFAMLSKDTHRHIALVLARRGYLVFNINYRLGVRNVYPAPLEDAARALQFVREHAARFGGDPTRIALAGESAGGNLVTALAVALAYERPEPFARRLFESDIRLRAVLATYGYLDLTDTDRMLGHPRIPPWAKRIVWDATVSYLGPAVTEATHANAALASPLLLLERERPVRSLPPFFVSCGTRDPLLSHSKRLKSALERLGVENELSLAQGEVHGYDALLWRPAAREKWRLAHDFLARHLSVARGDSEGAAEEGSPAHGTDGRSAPRT